MTSKTNKSINPLKPTTMRTQYVECKYRYQALKECPWASKLMKVCGGYMCFESVEDYRIAKNQK